MRPDEGATDRLCSHINNILLRLPSTPYEPCIFKVQHPLRNVNEAAFDPEIVSIGPYHYGKGSLWLMEIQKMRYLKQLLKRRNENSVERYVVALKELEERARMCYAEPINYMPDDFVKMLLFDGLFIIELFRKNIMKDLRDEHDIIFKFSRKYSSSLRRDLLLFENQIPFFVLSKLFDMTRIDNEKDFNLIALVVLSFELIQPDRYLSVVDRSSTYQVKHLLDLVQTASFVPASVETLSVEVVKRKNWPVMRCAVELKEAAVKFKMVSEGSFLNIKFKNGVMEIPNLLIEHSTESLFRNLIAYEQYCVDYEHHYITDYLMFMDCLINSAEDVELLRRHGIIYSILGNDEEISTMFNKLCKNVTVGKPRYSTICDDVNIHCGKRWNIWKAKLRNQYFDSPWTVISFLGAILLLLFTVVQTIFTIIRK